MSNENAERIGSAIGKVEVDVPVSGQGYGRFLSQESRLKEDNPSVGEDLSISETEIPYGWLSVTRDFLCFDINVAN